MREVQKPKLDIPWTLTDRLVSWWNPTKGIQRLRDRTMLAVAGGFTGASTSRRGLSAWRTTKNSADADLLPDLPILRERARDLCRNNPLAGGAISSTVTSVVGTGLSARPQVDADFLGMTPEEAKEWNKAAAREFALFADSEDADITRTQNFYGLQDLVLRSTLESGDCFSLLPFKAISNSNRPYELRIQVLEADRVSNPGNKVDSATIRGGVEVDQFGAPIRYHVTRTHPGDVGATKTEWDAFDAFGAATGRRNVLHHFRRVRPGQNRGIPFLAPIIEKLKQLDRYTDAEIMAAVVSGMFTVFVQTEGEGLNIDGGLGDDAGSSSSENDLKLGYGAIVEMKPNETITSANPGRPNPNFDPFFTSIVRQIGVGLEIPFEILLKHFNSSYSASRAAMVEAWKFYRGRREWLIASFCDPVYEAWMEEAVSLGRIDAPGFFDDPMIRKAYLGVAWYGDAMPQIDPVKEVDAADRRIKAGLSTHARETASLTGADWTTENEILAQELAERKAKGTLGIGGGTVQPGPMDANQNDNMDGSDNANP